MPLALYKRRHSKPCLAEIEERIAGGKLTLPKTQTMFAFLQQYQYCKCAWWTRGTNDYGKSIQPQSLKVYSKAAADAAVRKLNQADSPDRLKHSIETTASEWLAETALKEGRAKNTMENYENAIRKVTKFYGAKEIRWMADITPGHVNEMRSSWIASGAKSKTRALWLSVFRMLLEWAVKRDIIKENPINKITGVSLGVEDAPSVTLPLDPDGGETNYRTLLSGLSKQPSVAAICELMYHTGLRISDAIMFDADVMQLVPGRCWIYETKQIKTRTRVTTFIPLDLGERLRALPRLKGRFTFWDGRDPQLVYAGFWWRIRVAAKKVGVEGVRPHRFRDSFAVNMLNQGRSYDDVSVLLGHADPKTTIRYYAPWVKSRQTALLDRMFPQ